jgi:predicted GIY-YIG superfamily endonuclease
MTRDAYFRLRKQSEGLQLSTAATYILYGSYFDRSEEDRRKLYVGKTKDPKQRGDAHEREKDFWTDALVFTSSGPWMNSAHAGAIEKQFIEWVRDANRYIVTNGSIAGEEPLGPYDQAMLDMFIGEVRGIMQMAGIDVFEPDPFGLFYFEEEARYGRPAFKARGRRDGNAIVVLAGGVLPAPDADESGYEFLNDLEKDGRIKRHDDVVDVVLDARIPLTGPIQKILATHPIRWRTANRRTLSSFLRGNPSDDNAEIEPASNGGDAPL